MASEIQASNFLVGKDVGIISYNETPWKKFILNAITTMSADFVKMREMAAEIILNNEIKILNPIYIDAEKFSVTSSPGSS